MYKLIAILLVCFSTILGFCQSAPAPKYQAASILEVVPLHTTETGNQSTTVYKIVLQTNNSVYVLLYTSPEGPAFVNCAAGMQTTALVGDTSIRVNDMLGRTYEAPIVSRRAVAVAKK